MDKIDKISRPGMWESLTHVPSVGQGELIDRGSVITVEGKLLLLVFPQVNELRPTPHLKRQNGLSFFDRHLRWLLNTQFVLNCLLTVPAFILGDILTL